VTDGTTPPIEPTPLPAFDAVTIAGQTHYLNRASVTAIEGRGDSFSVIHLVGTSIGVEASAAEVDAALAANPAT
jgi:hypothetical protein